MKNDKILKLNRSPRRGTIDGHISNFAQSLLQTSFNLTRPGIPHEWYLEWRRVSAHLRFRMHGIFVVVDHPPPLSIKAIEIMSKPPPLPRSDLIKSPRRGRERDGKRERRDVSRGSKLTGGDPAGGRERKKTGRIEEGIPRVISSTGRNPSNVIYL